MSLEPLTAASVNTLVVSWKDAADMNDSVTSDAFVIPRRTGSKTISFLLSSFNFVFL